MAKDASHADGNRGGRRVTKEIGQRGNTRPRVDRSVRRAREVASSPRLQRAQAEQQAHEERLAKLAVELADQPHTPYRSILTVVPELVEESVVPSKTQSVEVATVDVSWARELLGQGYNINYVINRTGVPIEMLKSLVGTDGYARGRL